jgi:hypothetical protein
LYDDFEIEKARKIFSGECKFIAAALDINVISGFVLFSWRY